MPRTTLGLLVLCLAPALATAAPGPPGGEAKRFHGAVIVDPALDGVPRSVVARPANDAATSCGITPVTANNRYKLELRRDGHPRCRKELWFWLIPSAGPQQRFAERATFVGPTDRRLDLHLWAPMRAYGDVVSAKDLEGAAIVACAPSCGARRHAVCGGGSVFDNTFALQVLPRSPDRACPRQGGRFRFGVRTADGRLYPARAVGRFESGGAVHFDLVVGFPVANTVRSSFERLPRRIEPGGRAAFKWHVFLKTTRPTMDWWVEVDGAEGVALRSIAATDPIVHQPEHNTWVCLLHPSFPGPVADARSGRCAGFIGRPPSGRYTLLLELQAPRARGTIVVRLYNVAGIDHAQKRLRIAVR